MYSDDDIQYALEMTEVLHEPDRRIDTFSSTSFEFFLISEPMDQVGEVRVRSGTVNAEQPKILKPEAYADFDFDGFGEAASDFGDWLRRHHGDVSFLRYGFNFRRTEVREEVVHEPMAVVRDRIISEIEASNKPLSAVIAGVDDAWEICLLRFNLDMIQKSHGTNIFDFKRRGLL